MADQVSIGKTNLIPRFGPGRAGFAFKRSDSRLWTDIDGTKRPINTDYAKETTADLVLTSVQAGQRITVNSATTRTITLPAPAVGLAFEIFVKAPATGGAGHTIATKGATEKVYAKGITAAAGKGLINTQATGAIGDAVSIFSDGVDWFAKLTGTWARVA